MSHQNRYRRCGLVASRQLIVIAAILLVAVPVFFGVLPEEIARWYGAAASEAELDEDYSLATAKLDSAIAWCADEPTLYLRRALCRTRLEDYAAALEDCDRASELAPDQQAIGSIRSSILTHLGRHEESVAQMREVVTNFFGSPGDRSRLLNGLAYACAVGDLELDEGLEAANMALEIVGSHAGTLDPVGFLCYHRAHTAVVQGNKELALECLEEGERSATSAYERDLMRLNALAYLPHGQEEYADRVSTLKSHLAGIINQRALLLEELERTDQAEAARQRLHELAPDGTIAVPNPMELWNAAAALQRTSEMLDTRGFLYYRMGNLAAARHDTHQAIVLIEALLSTFSWQVDATKYRVVDMRETMNEHRQTVNGQAVMVYHQMLIHEALGMEEAAAKDRAQVIQLGFEPNEQLF